jgi:plasmid stability protein
MSALTVRNLDEEIVRRLRIRAAEHGRSAEAEHREILRMVLVEDERREQEREHALERLAAFRRRTAGRGSASSAQLLQDVRSARMAALTEPDASA